MNKNQRRGGLNLYPVMGVALAFSIMSQPAVWAKSAKPAPAPSKTVVQTKEATDPISPATLIGLVRSNHILDTQYPLHVRLEQNEVTVSTIRHPKATDQDCKIDAVLVAKTIMDAYPKDVARVKLLLNESSSEKVDEINVTTGDIKAYANGTITKDELLSSLELKRSDSQGVENQTVAAEQNGKNVVPGPYMVFRQMLASRIDKLKQNGTDTKPFESLLEKLELDVQKPRDEVSKDTILTESKELSRHLTEAEQAIIQARDIGKAYGYRNRAALDNGFGRRLMRQDGSHPDGPPQRGQKGGDGNPKNWGEDLWVSGLPDQALGRRVVERIQDMKASGTNVNRLYARLYQIKNETHMGQATQGTQDLKDLARQVGVN